MGNIFRKIMIRLKGIRVYALVGRSGTGKSFRAKLVAEKHKINLMIDDGLLIRDQKIIAGKSAKQANNYLGAVKTAIFEDPEHLAEVQNALSETPFKRILLIGTSEKMVGIIVAKLGLPQVMEWIRIEDISTEDEIQRALHSRSREGKHVIPVPALEISKDYGHILLDSVKIFFQNWSKKGKMIEKSVVRPEFHKHGKISINEGALSQMVLHCIDEFDHQIEVEKVSVVSRGNSYRINLLLGVDYGLQLTGTFNELQQYIISSIQRYTGIMINEVNIRISQVGAKNKRSKS